MFEHALSDVVQMLTDFIFVKMFLIEKQNLIKQTPSSPPKTWWA